MIIDALISLLYSVFYILTLPIQIPSFPDTVKTFLATAIDYMSSGVAIVGQFLDMEYLFLLFSLVMLVDVALLIYKLIMWVLRKIPMLGIE